VVTSFAVEASKTLTRDASDITNELLLTLVRGGGSPNFTSPADVPFIPKRQDIQINVFYFLSLTITLSVSVVCILGQQWIRSYKDKPVFSSMLKAAVDRQCRFDSLYFWKIPQILSLLPLILQLAVVLFFVGLLIQLWDIGNQTILPCVGAICIFTMAFVLLTTILPAPVFFQKNDSLRGFPFRSAQSLLFISLCYTLAFPFWLAFYLGILKGDSWDSILAGVGLFKIRSWLELEMWFGTDLLYSVTTDQKLAALEWSRRNVLMVADTARATLNLLSDRSLWDTQVALDQVEDLISNIQSARVSLFVIAC
jgi:magnesium-transporting ATPase (P-type)